MAELQANSAVSISSTPAHSSENPASKLRGLDQLVFTLPAVSSPLEGGSGQHDALAPQVVYLVGETRPFRDLARVLPLPEAGAKVVEVGFSYGDTLRILAKRCQGNVVGFDCSQECATECVARYPTLAGKVHVADALRPRGAERVRAAASSSLGALAADDGSASLTGAQHDQNAAPDESAAHEQSAAQVSDEPCSAAFVDIGGDRHAEAVLNLCHAALRKPPVLVVKCRLLFKAALKALSEASSSPSTSSPAPTSPSFQQLESFGRGSVSEDIGKVDQEEILSSWWLALTAKAFAGDGKSGSAGIGTPSWQLRHRNEKQRRRAEVRAQREREQENHLLQLAKYPALDVQEPGSSTVEEEEPRLRNPSA